MNIVSKLTCLTTFVLTSQLLIGTVNAAPKAPVKVETVKRASLTTTFNVHGTVYGKNDVDLTAGANGKLIYVVEPGTRVNAGDAIARIDMLPLQLEQAEQQLLIERAQVNLEYQKIELARLQSLAKTDAAAVYQLDLTQNKHDLASSDIALAKLKLKQINDRIERATVTAPFDGIVSQRYRQAGSDVNRADRLVRLLDTHGLHVKLFVPVKYFNQMKPGMTVAVSAEQYASRAQVVAVIPSADMQSQTIEVRAALASKLNNENSTHWATGQLVDVEIPIADDNTSLLVNRDALIIRREGVHVVRIDAENKAQKVPVIVGKGQGQLVEVKSAGSEKTLNEGDTIAVRGAERLVDAQVVEIQVSPT
ncbi:MAG: efflux RND transporter periplasmic adaptor subunit [Gammaproteobacteria bacterium]|nr:efflux RND transporter periplasmic adaptor subunit [Gammaproteobacteria bacterium]